MTFQGDPYRVLGVAAGASVNEIRSAYRRLVKQWHPDAAGDRALPRFLAIQAAYEQLVDAEGRLRPATRTGPDGRGGPGGAGTGAGPGGAGRGAGAGRSSAADPTRARASRDAWRARRAGWGTGGATGASGPNDASGGAGASSGTRAGGPDARPGGAGSGPRSEEPGKGPRERRTHHRTTRKATPGSTTYDEAAEPLDPAWGGAGWYGASSGTYWTINPREYADPRKHGPEYQARARRAAAGGAVDDDPDAAETGAGAGAGTGPTTRGGQPGEAAAAGETDAAGSDAWRWSEQGRTTTGGDPHDWGARGWSFATDPSAAAGGDDVAPGDRPRRPPVRPPRPAGTPASTGQGGIPDLEPCVRRAAPANLRRLALGPDRRWRFVLAFVAWPPIGVGVASLIDLLTGCGTFAATCTEPARLLPVAVQPLIVLVLAALPAFTAAAAFAGLVALASALPAATIIAFGSRWQPDVARALLALVVAVVYTAALVVSARRARGQGTGTAGTSDPGPGPLP